MKTDMTTAGYVVHDNKVLLIHHRKLDLWLPVGGHMDPNETPDETTIREIKEEVGLDVEVLGVPDVSFQAPVKKILALPFHVNVHSVGDHDHCCLFYVCKAKNPEALNPNHELKAAEWFSLEDLNQERVPDDVKRGGRSALELFPTLVQ